MKFRHIPFILLAVVMLILTTATFVEKYAGSAAAYDSIYGSWWFVAVWMLLVVSSLAVIFKRKLQKRPATLLLHLALVMILLGALVTHIWGRQGAVQLRMDTPQTTFTDRESNEQVSMPFALQLRHFRVETYPGTQSPMDYVSVVEVKEGASTADSMSISMNNIGQYQGYRFYQSGYDEDGQGVILSVSHDVWGIGITYTGYALLFMAMLLMLVLPKEGFRRLLATPCLLLCCMVAQAEAPKTLPAETAAQFGDLYVYYNGRICPLQTLARDFTTKLYGKSSYQGLSAEQVLTGWMLFPTNWIEQPFIKVKGDVADLIGVDSKYASYNDFFSYGDYKLQQRLNEMRGGQEVEGARAISEADEKMNILLMLFNGQLVKMFPYNNGNGQLLWLAHGIKLPKDMPQEKGTFIRQSLNYLGELAWMQEYGEIEKVVGKIKVYQQREAAPWLPSEELFEAEKLYNQAEQTRPMAMLLMTIGLIAFFVYLFAWLRNSRPKRSITITANIIVIAALLYQLCIICLRGYVSGHLPLANGYETMQFMSLCALLGALFLQRRFLLAMPFGILLAGLTQLVSMMGESNPQITPLMPVLASPLLSMHVCVIMLAYVLLAFTMFNGVTALLLLLQKKDYSQQVRQLTRSSQLLLYPAAFCLAAGIFIGAIWANQSWGRYWGWDPKEVWALITLLFYSIAFHRESMRWLQRPLYYHLFMTLAFLSILMTYFGVNFFLGGMHSYA